MSLSGEAGHDLGGKVAIVCTGFAKRGGISQENHLDLPYLRGFTRL